MLSDKSDEAGAMNDMALSGQIFKSVGEFDKADKGFFKVALVLATDSNGNIIDYHWYQQNQDGSWSHKPSTLPVRNTDASGNLIYNPSTADRNHQKEGQRVYNYNVGTIFYQVSW